MPNLPNLPNLPSLPIYLSRYLSRLLSIDVRTANEPRPTRGWHRVKWLIVLFPLLNPTYLNNVVV